MADCGCTHGGLQRSTHAFTSSEFATHQLPCRTNVAQLGICHGPAEVPESAVRSYQEPVRRDDVETLANVARNLLHRLHLCVLGIDHTDSQDLVGWKVPESVELCVSPVAHLYMDHIGGRCLEDGHHLGGLILEDVALAVDASVADVPELRHLDTLEEGLLHLYLPHLLRVGGQYIDQLDGLQPDALEILELLVHSRCYGLRQCYWITVVLVIDDDALLCRSEEGHLEWLLRRPLHGGHHAFEDRPPPGDLGGHGRLVQGLAPRPITS